MSTQAAQNIADVAAAADQKSFRDYDATTGLTIPAWVPVIAVIVGGTIAHIYMHYAVHGVFNWSQALLAFFLVLNILINFWEFTLHKHGDRIAEEYAELGPSYKGREMQAANDVFLRRIPLLSMFAFRHWTGIWSTYCLFDPGYAKRDSFGYNIDVGNGWSTIVPALIFGFGMTFNLVDPRILGIIGVAMFWQMFYGTVVYFFQFFHAGRHKGHTTANLALFVGTSNGMWFVFPLWGIWVSVMMIFQQSYAVFGVQ